MTAMRTDLVDPVIDHVRTAMREVFDPDSTQPPIGGGSTEVRLLAGDAIPLAMWNAHADEGCDEPFLWVRLARRFRSREFPAAEVAATPCGAPAAAMIEIGVGRCAVMDAEPSWDQYAAEAEIALDDSWRIELALCRAASLVTGDHTAKSAAVDDVVPFGPEGGVIAWTGNLYVQL